MTHIAQSNNFGQPIQSVYPAGTTQTKTISAVAALSAAFATGITTIRICSDTTCWYAIGKAPVAVIDACNYLPAGVVEYPQVCEGDKISVIGTAGKLNITECL